VPVKVEQIDVNLFLDTYSANEMKFTKINLTYGS